MMANIESTATPTQPYKNWLLSWASHLSGVPVIIHVPSTATSVTTPLVSSRWKALLTDHPDQSLVNFFITGITYGFRIGFNCPPQPLVSAKKNMYCAMKHQEVVDQYIAEEISSHRVAGPFSPCLVPSAHTSRFGVMPKSH